MREPVMTSGNLLTTGSAILILLLAVSGANCYDLPTWFLEVLPVLIALPVLWGTHGRFPLTTLLYLWIFAHAAVLILGGTYTYARVPLGFQIQDWFDLQRNPYDRIGHFFQGFVPTLVARELFIRRAFVRTRAMTAFLALCVAMAVSACYELIEWGVALALGHESDEFLGTQGDPWDTQNDMFMALIGGSTALALFSRLHDRQIRRLG